MAGMANTLHFGGLYPEELIEGFIGGLYDVIKIWQNNNLDNQMARKLCFYRPLADGIREYPVQKIDMSANEVIPQAPSEPGQTTTFATGNAYDKVWRWPTGFMLNEEDIKHDPRLQSQHVEGCVAKIYRAEDKAFYAGRTANGISGFLTMARANPRGKIVATGGDNSTTFNNSGSWLDKLGDSGKRDIYTDLLTGRGLLKPKYRTALQNIFLAGNADTISALDQPDPYSATGINVSDRACKLFGRTPNDPVNSWAIINDQIADGYAYLVVKNPEVAELLESKAVFIDDRYPMEPIGNIPIAIYEDVGFSFKDVEGFVEIAIGAS